MTPIPWETPQDPLTQSSAGAMTGSAGEIRRPCSMAGAFLFSASVLFMLGEVVLVAWYPGYLISENFISDLGVGPTATGFSVMLIACGVLIMAASWLLHTHSTSQSIPLLLFASGAGGAGVGIFPETLGAIHFICAGIAFLSGGVAAVLLSSRLHGPFRLFSAILGVLSLFFIVSHILHLYFSLGPGGSERLIAYPLFLWMAGFGGHLMADRRAS